MIVGSFNSNRQRMFTCKAVTNRAKQTSGVLYITPVCISVTSAVFPAMLRAITTTPKSIACTISNNVTLAQLIYLPR